MNNLAPLLQAYRQHPAVRTVLDAISTPGARLQVKGLKGAQESLVISSAFQQQKNPVYLYVAGAKEEAAYHQNDMAALLGGESVYFFPDSFKRPAYFDDLHAAQMLQRSEVINNITGEQDKGCIIVTYPEALFEKVVRPEILAQARIEVKKGEKLDVDFMMQVLIEYGFVRSDFVYEPGQFSIRGGLIDLFSFGNELPYRIELFDDEVETIRIFDPATQLSQRNLSAVNIVPNLNTRFRQDQKVSLLQILPPQTVVWMKDQQILLDRLQYCFERAEQFAGKLTALDSSELREIFRDRAFLYPGDVVQDLADRSIIHLA
ncbi:MAG: hypothetical protein IT269_12630 [Saprospiraceae bacterium]|nr:hypothetical protein [Saprospiraceae bacterium]